MNYYNIVEKFVDYSFCSIILYKVLVSVYINIYGHKVQYHVYRINNTIFLGTVHVNSYNSIYPEILEYIDNTNTCYTEINAPLYDNKQFAKSIVNLSFFKNLYNFNSLIKFYESRYLSSIFLLDKNYTTPFQINR
uniref:Uncharacterized protein n=1 Tax=viral metagenome TaxID=1070528 RepID=A0A6C0ADY6_9ZZZZ